MQYLVHLLLGQSLFAVLDQQLDVQQGRRWIVDHGKDFAVRQLEASHLGPELDNFLDRLRFDGRRTLGQVLHGLIANRGQVLQALALLLLLPGTLKNRHDFAIRQQRVFLVQAGMESSMLCQMVDNGFVHPLTSPFDDSIAFS